MDRPFKVIMKLVEDRVNELGLWTCDLDRLDQFWKYLKEEHLEDLDHIWTAGLWTSIQRPLIASSLRFCHPEIEVEVEGVILHWTGQLMITVDEEVPQEDRVTRGQEALMPYTCEDLREP